MPAAAVAYTVYIYLRICSGATAALMGLRWIIRGGHSNGLIALVASVVYMSSRKMLISDGRRVQLGAPGDRTKDRVQTTMAQMAAEQVDRETRRERMEQRYAEEQDAEELGEEDDDEPHRVLSAETAAAAMAQRTAQQPAQQRPPARHRNAHYSAMSTVVETPGQQEGDEEDEEDEQDEQAEQEEPSGQDGEAKDEQHEDNGSAEDGCNDFAVEPQPAETDVPLQAAVSESDEPANDAETTEGTLHSVWCCASFVPEQRPTGSIVSFRNNDRLTTRVRYDVFNCGLPCLYV